jgi:hypothetical protein
MKRDKKSSSSQDTEWKNPSADGQAFLFSFPYFVLCKQEPRLLFRQEKVGNSELRVYPFFRSGAENFIGAPEIDPRNVPFIRPVKTRESKLFSFSVLPTFADAGSGKEIKLLHADSLRIDVISGDSENDQQITATRFSDVFLRSLRVFSQQWWIGHPQVVFAGEIRNIFSISREGLALNEPHAVTQVRTLAGFELPVDQNLFDLSFKMAIEDTPPHLSYELALDGMYEHAQGRLRRAILDFAIACEVARDDFFKAVWRNKFPQRKFGRGAAYQGSHDLSKHLNNTMYELVGSSLRLEKPSVWEALKVLWLLRNEVAHGTILDGEIADRLSAVGDAFGLTIEVVSWLQNHPARR